MASSGGLEQGLRLMLVLAVGFTGIGDEDRESLSALKGSRGVRRYRTFAFCW